MTLGEVRSGLKARPHRSKRCPRCRGLRISRRYFAAHEYCLANDRTGKASAYSCRSCRAPVKAPFSWPNNSEAISEEGIEAQFTLIKAWLARCEPLCMARAISSFPVPVSPVIKTVESVGATFTMLERTVFNAGDEPTISSNM